MILHRKFTLIVLSSRTFLLAWFFEVFFFFRPFFSQEKENEERRQVLTGNEMLRNEMFTARDDGMMLLAFVGLGGGERCLGSSLSSRFL